MYNTSKPGGQYPRMRVQSCMNSVLDLLLEISNSLSIVCRIALGLFKLLPVNRYICRIFLPPTREHQHRHHHIAKRMRLIRKVPDPRIGPPSMMNLLLLAVGPQLTMSPRQQALAFHSETNRFELGFHSTLMMGGLPEPAADFLSTILSRLQIDPLLDQRQHHWHLAAVKSEWRPYRHHPVVGHQPVPVVGPLAPSPHSTGCLDRQYRWVVEICFGALVKPSKEYSKVIKPAVDQRTYCVGLGKRNLRPLKAWKRVSYTALGGIS